MCSLSNLYTLPLRMNLYLLRQLDCLTVHYDLRNDWLFLDWQGEMTLPAVQQACLAVADCYLKRPYTHVLNNNEQVTGVSWSVAAWLATDFLPLMTLAGIEQLAWIYSSTLPGFSAVQTVLNWLPNSPITTFDNIADAVAWLKLTRAGQRDCLLPQRPPAMQTKLAQEIQALHRRVAANQPKLRPVQRKVA